MKSILVKFIILSFLILNVGQASELSDAKDFALKNIYRILKEMTTFNESTQLNDDVDSLKEASKFDWMNNPILIKVGGVFLVGETFVAVGLNIHNTEIEFITKHISKIGGQKIVGKCMVGVGIAGLIGSVVFVIVNDLLFPESATASSLTDYYMSPSGLESFLRLVLESPKSVENYMKEDELFAAFVVEFNKSICEKVPVP